MTVCGPYTDAAGPLQWCFVPPSQRLHVSPQWLYVTSWHFVILTMTCVPQLWLCVTFTVIFVYFHSISVSFMSLSHTMSLCPLTMILCVLKMMVCDLTVTMCVFIMTVCPHIYSVTFIITLSISNHLCALTVTLDVLTVTHSALARSWH